MQTIARINGSFMNKGVSSGKCLTKTAFLVSSRKELIHRVETAKVLAANRARETLSTSPADVTRLAAMSSTT